MGQINETENLRLFISGDSSFIKSFYKLHFEKIRKFVVTNSGTETEAKDIFQDALVIAYQKLKSKSLVLDCALSTYVYAVSRNLWMNVLRRKNKVIFRDELPDIDEGTNNEIIENISNQERQNIYQKYFLKLSEDCQKLLNYFFAGKKMEEISKEMRYSEGYTRKKKFKCKERLIKMVETDPIFEELVNEFSKERES